MNRLDGRSPLSAKRVRTQVAIVGAGPAGLTLACLLHNAGIESVVLENRSRQYVEERIRAGVLEQGTVEVLDAAGVGARMHREGIVHHGIYLQFAGERHRIPLSDLADGRSIVIYGQTEVVKDLIEARLEAGLDLRFGVADVSVHELDSDRPHVRFVDGHDPIELECDAIVGADGFHGVCRPAISEHLRVFSREYPFAWLGILAAAPPSSDELVYAHHERGFALLSLRSAERTRLYLQVAADERLEEWPDERIWEELQRRVCLDGWTLVEGEVLEKGITPMRSFVVEPMQHGRLFLAGDSAHIVPPTGAKGLNLAVSDVAVLADALIDSYRNGDRSALAAYSQTCLRRVWRAEHFSYWMTTMLHQLGDDPFDTQLQLSQLRYIVSSEAAARTLAENYVGLPVEHGAVTAG
jgi:p-hydroxybenzoate 3-monooxygenase